MYEVDIGHDGTPGQRVREAAQRGVVLGCHDEHLVGVLHAPYAPRPVGVVIVVGGPSYRVGSHRLFVLLARRLARAGHAVLRFDHRGMGDSSGGQRAFDAIADDIEAAVNYLRQNVPEVSSVVLWGLCDAATAICFSAAELKGVTGIVLLNPWVRADDTLARSQLKSYYVKRAISVGFWRKAFSTRLDYRGSLRELFSTLRRSLASGSAAKSDTLVRTLADRLLVGLARFTGSVLLVLSGNDLTAVEFREAMRRSGTWANTAARGNFTRRDLVAADHTFSRREWRSQLEDWTLEWLATL